MITDQLFLFILIIHFLGNFVQTSNNINHPDCIDIGYGLTKECTNKAIRILNAK
jgi:hypothetical protein